MFRVILFYRILSPLSTLAKSFPLQPLPAARKAIYLARRQQSVSIDEGPVGDLMLDAIHEGLATWAQSRQGWLYLAYNPATANLYKIGQTRGSVARRMKELNSAGVLVPWQAVLVWKVYDAPGLEARAHRACAEYRIRNELFQAPWQILAENIEACLALDYENVCKYLEGLWAGSLDLSTVLGEKPVDRLTRTGQNPPVLATSATIAQFGSRLARN